MGDLSHTLNLNPSEADDEEGWEKSSTDEANLSGVVPFAQDECCSFTFDTGSELTSEHDRTRKHSSMPIWVCGAHSRFRLSTGEEAILLRYPREK